MRSRDEVYEGLLDQMRMLASSIRSYRAGHDFEAARVATNVINIVYDDGKAKSILTQLGERENMAFISTDCIKRDGNLIIEHPLAFLNWKDLNRPFLPLHMEGPEYQQPEPIILNFEGWWTKCFIIKTGGYMQPGMEPAAEVLTRKRLSLALRNSDGGGHFAPRIGDELYAKMKREGVGWFEGPSSDKPLLGLQNASMVQIGYELMNSLLTHFRDIPAPF